MIFDTMTWSVMIIVAVLSFIVILLALLPRARQNNSDD